MDFFGRIRRSQVRRIRGRVYWRGRTEAGYILLRQGRKACGARGMIEIEMKVCTVGAPKYFAPVGKLFLKKAIYDSDPKCPTLRLKVHGKIEYSPGEVVLFNAGLSGESVKCQIIFRGKRIEGDFTIEGFECSYRDPDIRNFTAELKSEKIHEIFF